MDFSTQLESTLGFTQISKSNCKLLGNKSSNGLVSGGANDHLESTNSGAHAIMPQLAGHCTMLAMSKKLIRTGHN